MTRHRPYVHIVQHIDAAAPPLGSSGDNVIPPPPPLDIEDAAGFSFDPPWAMTSVTQAAAILCVALLLLPMALPPLGAPRFHCRGGGSATAAVLATPPLVLDVVADMTPIGMAQLQAQLQATSNPLQADAFAAPPLRPRDVDTLARVRMPQVTSDVPPSWDCRAAAVPHDATTLQCTWLPSTQAPSTLFAACSAGVTNVLVTRATARAAQQQLKWAFHAQRVRLERSVRFAQAAAPPIMSFTNLTDASQLAAQLRQLRLRLHATRVGASPLVLLPPLPADADVSMVAAAQQEVFRLAAQRRATMLTEQRAGAGGSWNATTVLRKGAVRNAVVVWGEEGGAGVLGVRDAAAMSRVLAKLVALQAALRTSHRRALGMLNQQLALVSLFCGACFEETGDWSTLRVPRAAQFLARMQCASAAHH